MYTYIRLVQMGKENLINKFLEKVSLNNFPRIILKPNKTKDKLFP